MEVRAIHESSKVAELYLKSKKQLETSYGCLSCVPIFPNTGAPRRVAMTEASVEKEVKARYAIWYSLGLYSREELPV
jgi:hypothetical protein